MTIHFSDSFAGTAGTNLTAHTPNCAPVGFAYKNENTGPDTILQLTGNGATTGLDVGYSTSAPASSDNSSPAFSVTLADPYTFNITATLSANAVPNFLLILAQLERSDGSYLDITFNRNGSISVDALNNAVGDGYAGWGSSAGAFPIGVEHTVSVAVSGPTLTVDVDGGGANAATYEGTDDLGLAWDRLYYIVDRDIAPDESQLSEVEIADDGSPAPATVVIEEALIKRGTIRNTVGVEVDELSVSLLCNANVSYGNVPLTQFARQGGFDGARMTLTRAFYPTNNATSCGSLNLFSGRVGPLTVSGHEIAMGIKSDLELLDVQMPRNVHSESCIHTLYDAGCNISAATFTVTGNTTANSTAFNVNCNLAQTAGYFDLGVMRFTSGENNGTQRTVRVHSNGVLTVMQPFGRTPAAGDLFTVRPGCDKLFATCSAKFTNTGNFRGYPYIPVPETTY